MFGEWLFEGLCMCGGGDTPTLGDNRVSVCLCVYWGLIPSCSSMGCKLISAPRFIHARKKIRTGCLHWRDVKL